MFLKHQGLGKKLVLHLINRNYFYGTIAVIKKLSSASRLRITGCLRTWFKKVNQVIFSCLHKTSAQTKIK